MASRFASNAVKSSVSGVRRSQALSKYHVRAMSSHPPQDEKTLGANSEDSNLAEQTVGNYIVSLKEDVVLGDFIETLALSQDSKITHQYPVVHGIAGTFTDEDLNVLRAHGDVKFIEEENITTVFATNTDAA